MREREGRGARGTRVGRFENDDSATTTMRTTRPPYRYGASVQFRLTQNLPATAHRMMNPMINVTAPAVLSASRVCPSISGRPVSREVDEKDAVDSEHLWSPGLAPCKRLGRAMSSILSLSLPRLLCLRRRVPVQLGCPTPSSSRTKDASSGCWCEVQTNFRGLSKWVIPFWKVLQANFTTGVSWTPKPVSTVLLARLATRHVG